MTSASIVDFARYGPYSDKNKTATLDEANAYCRRLARTHYENFTVASWLLPRRLHQHFANVYAYCRTADDLADETDDAQESLKLLQWWEDELRECYQGRAEHPVFVALKATIEEFDIPIDPFADLLIAFRQDQRVDRYKTFDDLLAYCRNSANPVGRLVLHLGRCCNEETTPLSDSICTGLQLVNFWQDVARDWTNHRRIYLPRETMCRFTCDDETIAESIAGSIADGTANDALRQAIAHEVDRAETYLNKGRPLVELVSPALRMDVELFVRGGLEVAKAIRLRNFDVIKCRPTVGKWTQLRILAQAWGRQKTAGTR